MNIQFIKLLAISSILTFQISCPKESGTTESAGEYRQALILYSNRQFEEAAIIAGRSIDKNPDFLAPRILRQKIYLLQKNHTAAIAAGKETLAISPDCITALVLTAFSEIEYSRDYTSASARLDRALNLSPDDSGVWFTIGFLHEKQGNTQFAIKAYTVSTGQVDPILFSYSHLAAIYAAAGMKNKAAHCLRMQALIRGRPEILPALPINNK